MLAGNRHKAGLDIWIGSFPVPLDPDPLVQTALISLLLADNRDIILRSAGGLAGVAAGAAVEVDGHGPFASWPTTFRINEVRGSLDLRWPFSRAARAGRAF